jgi:3-oxoacyl-[acyl-carrier protein] reductase
MKREVAVVTGASQGIGLAIVRRLASDGFQVHCCGSTRAKIEARVAELKAEGLDVEGAVFDVTDRAAVAAAFDAVPAIDVLVNNAGIFVGGGIEALTDAQFERALSVNVRGIFTVSQEALKRMGEGGRIVNIASRGALGSQGQAAYATSKAAVVGLTRCMAMDLSARRITVNAVGPGLIDTPMVQGLPETVREGLRRALPHGEMGRPEDVAHAVAFLASRQAATITGQHLMVDDGKALGLGPSH